MKKEIIRNRLERAGWKITSCMGYKDGVQTIVGYTATKMNHCYRAASITGLYKEVHK